MHLCAVLAGVPPLGVKVKAGQVKETDVIEIAAEFNRRDAAEDFLRVLPFAYMWYLTDNRRSEVENALDFSRKRRDGGHGDGGAGRVGENHPAAGAGGA